LPPPTGISGFRAIGRLSIAGDDPSGPVLAVVVSAELVPPTATTAAPTPAAPASTPRLVAFVVLSVNAGLLAVAMTATQSPPTRTTQESRRNANPAGTTLPRHRQP
jgi:hypothetical protein